MCKVKRFCPVLILFALFLHTHAYSSSGLPWSKKKQPTTDEAPPPQPQPEQAKQPEKPKEAPFNFRVHYMSNKDSSTGTEHSFLLAGEFVLLQWKNMDANIGSAGSYISVK